MVFELKLSGVKAEDLVEIPGEDGPFFVRTISGREDLWGGSFYGDKNCQFFFYSEVIKVPNGGYIMNVFKATSERNNNIGPAISFDVINIVKNNIKTLFLTRDVNFPKEFAKDGHIPTDVIFTWSLS